MSDIKTDKEWKEIISLFKKSGLTATQWCKDQNLSYHAFM
ncbi:IS66 family insertion sequence element accessory protein TnpA, partial [Vallitalea sp.]